MKVEQSQCDINLVTERVQFEQLRYEWNRLVAEEHYAITNSWEWLFTWWEVYSESRELYIITFTINNELVAILPFQRVVDNRYLLNRKIIRFLGTGENEDDETCSEYIDLIIANNYRERVIKEFIQYLKRKKSEWHCLLLADIRSLSPNLQALSQQGMHGIKISESLHKAPYIDLPGSWEELLATTRINAREQLNRKQNLINKQGNIEYRQYQGVNITDSIVDSFIDLHQKRWESTDKPGCFSSQLFTIFHKKLIDRFSATNQAIMYFMSVNNKAIAARYCFEFDNITYDYQTGLDLTFETKSSPGTVLLAHVIRERIKKENHTYDFFKGKKGSYKYKWTDKDQSLSTLILCRKHIKNILFVLLDNRSIFKRVYQLFRKQ